MKKNLVLALFLLIINKAFAEEYLAISFQDKKSIPTSRIVSGKVTVDFVDSKLDTLLKGYTVTEFTREFPSADYFPDTIAPAVRLRLVYRIRIRAIEKNINNFQAEILSIKSKDIKYAEIMNDPIALTVTPNDYNNCFACSDWPRARDHMNLVNAQGAWEFTRGYPCIKIGISDAAFQQHTDLNNKVTSNTNTYIPASPSTSPTHGTEVAGMAGAETNNNTGVSSAGFNIGLEYYNMTYDGILQAIYNGCKVVNCSWYSSYSSILQTPTTPIAGVLETAELYGVTIVAAAGNNITGTATDYFYPASYAQVISVTSVGSQWDVGTWSYPGNWKDCHRQFLDPNDTRYNQTHQHNDMVDLCAPGYYVETTGPNNSYVLRGGSSYAAPQVSAAAALLYSINPNFSIAQIRYFLTDNATDIYSVWDNNTWNGLLGAGRLNMFQSMVDASQYPATANAIMDIAWYKDYNFSTQINPNNFWRYKHINLVPQFSYFCEEGWANDGMEWIVQWGDEEKIYYGFAIDIDLDNDFTQLSPARYCSFPELKVYVRHRDCFNSCSWSLYYIESGHKIGGSACRGISNSIVNSPVKNTIGGIKVFPVPAKNEINIVIPESETSLKIIPYSVYNAESKLVRKGSFTKGNNKMSISELPKGVYYIHAYNTKPVTLPFLKQ